jgi:hypothetical protein
MRTSRGRTVPARRSAARKRSTRALRTTIAAMSFPARPYFSASQWRGKTTAVSTQAPASGTPAGMRHALQRAATLRGFRSRAAARTAREDWLAPHRATGQRTARIRQRRSRGGSAPSAQQCASPPSGRCTRRPRGAAPPVELGRNGQPEYCGAQSPPPENEAAERERGQRWRNGVEPRQRDGAEHGDKPEGNDGSRDRIGPRGGRKPANGEERHRDRERHPPSNTCRYEPAVPVSRAGTTKRGTAPGGYSLATSRYGTLPPVIASP